MDNNIGQWNNGPKLVNHIHDSHILFVDSRQGNEEGNTSFVVDLNTTNHGPYKNVSYVELLGMSMNTQCLVDSGEHYVVLDIKELNSRVHSTSPFVANRFCTVYFDVGTTGVVTKAVKGTDFDRKFIEFQPTLSALSKLTVSIRDGFTGNLVADHGYVTLLFKVKTRNTLQ